MRSYQCEVCHNEYDKTFIVTMDGKDHEFDCFECAIHALSPHCVSCKVPIVGRGVEADGVTFCSGSCARRSGHKGICDNTDRLAA